MFKTDYPQQMFFSADDIFGIDELVLYDGEWKESNYAVSGEVLDGVSDKLNVGIIGKI